MTCVHCGKEIINHKCHDPGGNYFACPCFNVKSGRFIGYHPTNRFTPRSEEQFSSGTVGTASTGANKVNAEVTANVAGAPANAEGTAAAILRSEEQVMSENFGQHTTDEALASRLGDKGSTGPHPSSDSVGSERLTSAVPAVAGAEKAATIAVDGPATVQPEPPVCEKCGQPRVFSNGYFNVMLPCQCEHLVEAPQPAQTACPAQQHSGDCSIYGADPATNRDSKICDCGYLRQRASSPNPSDAERDAWCDHQVAIEAQYKTLGKPGESKSELSRSHEVRSVLYRCLAAGITQEEILLLLQPCPRCTELERERDALQQAMAEGTFHVLRIRCAKHVTVAQQNTNEYSGGECGACIAEERDQANAGFAVMRDSLTKLASLKGATALLAERDALQAKVERLEVALREIREITLPSKVGGAGSGYTIALKCGTIANAALAGGKKI